MRGFLRSALAASLALVLASCVGPDQPDPRSSEKTFTSLVFLKAENPSLDKDYTTVWNSGRRLWVTTAKAPWDADLSAVKARFQVSDGATAAVDGTAQTSGVTPNDFSSVVRYTITAEDGSLLDHLVLMEREPAPPSDGPLAVSVTVVSYNAEMFEGGSVGALETVHADIATMLKNATADIVAFTEISVSGTSNDVPTLQAALSSQGWAMPYAATMDLTYQSDQDICILSRYPIQSYQAVLQPPANEWPRAGLKAVIRVSNAGGAYADVTVFAFHLKAMDDPDSLAKRLAQSAALAEHLRTTWGESLTTAYVVVAGDMNTVSTGDRGSTTSTLGYLRVLDDADATNDFHAVNEELLPTTGTYATGTTVLDHIILSPALYSLRYRHASVMVKKYDPDVTVSSLSDHYPVLLELDL